MWYKGLNYSFQESMSTHSSTYQFFTNIYGRNFNPTTMDKHGFFILQLSLFHFSTGKNGLSLKLHTGTKGLTTGSKVHVYPYYLVLSSQTMM